MFGCANGACKADPCAGKVCDTAPPYCADNYTLTTYTLPGTCVAGTCNYTPGNKNCPFGCANGACKPDPCTGVTCNTQQPAVCSSSATATTYAATGTCDNTSGTAKCVYQSMDTNCGSNKACSGAGVCSVCKSDSSCGTACAACTGGTPKCKDLGTASQCVGCLGDADCSSGVKCNLTTNTCQTPPSCQGLAPTCGPSGNLDCCASNTVPGVPTATFYRSYDGSANYNSQAYPAQVSDFRLDNYEITVGRFRRFVSAYSQTMIPAGAGKNPNNSNDPGWDTTWNASLDADATALTVAVRCGKQTWKDTVGSAAAESLPINCLNWFEAQAFCIWDGGRLPTEAEWNYAASGGTQQRLFPWGSTVPGDDANIAAYGCFYPTPATNCTVASIAPVGVIPAGNGRWGHADLGGNMWEWAQDWWITPYSITPCNNCSNLVQAFSVRILRGGCVNSGIPDLYASHRNYADPTGHGFGTGARCARAVGP
jgi:formylglycine-generating enzyme required for sulfatase activity